MEMKIKKEKHVKNRSKEIQMIKNRFKGWTDRLYSSLKMRLEVSRAKSSLKIRQKISCARRSLKMRQKINCVRRSLKMRLEVGRVRNSLKMRLEVSRDRDKSHFETGNQSVQQIHGKGEDEIKKLKANARAKKITENVFLISFSCYIRRNCVK